MSPAAVRVLLVDDESIVRRSLGRLLERAGFYVSAVARGDEALAALRAGGHDAIISDLRMPGLTGQQLYERVRAERPDLLRRIIFLSGDLHQDEVHEFLVRSGCPSLEKPFDFNALLALLGGAPSEAHAS